MFGYTRHLRTALVLCAAVVAEGAAAAQAPPPPLQPPVANNQPGYRAKQIIGSKVSIQGNVAIGTVDDVVFADDGHVEYLVVVNDGKLVAVPWEAAKFNFEQRTAVVDITPERFKTIPTFTVERYPAFLAPTYRAEIYGFYGLKPRELRPLPFDKLPPPKKKF
jgi:hypothetical protein